MFFSYITTGYTFHENPQSTKNIQKKYGLPVKVARLGIVSFIGLIRKYQLQIMPLSHLVLFQKYFSLRSFVTARITLLHLLHLLPQLD